MKALGVFDFDLLPQIPVFESKITSTSTTRKVHFSLGWAVGLINGFFLVNVSEGKQVEGFPLPN